MPESHGGPSIYARRMSCWRNDDKENHMPKYAAETREGHRAFINRVPLYDNPYTEPTHADKRRHRLWEQGWLEQNMAQLDRIMRAQGLKK